MAQEEWTRDRLVSCQKQFSKWIGEVEILFPTFERFSDEMKDKIMKTKDENVIFYAKCWFKLYLGIKDEIMVLSKGELIRPYHKVMHKEWLHKREKDAHLYNSKYKLTCCCRDGIDYEYRKLVDKYGYKSSLDKIASKNDILAEKVDELVRKIDNCFKQLDASLMKKRASAVQVVTMHNAEVVKAKLNAQIFINFNRNSFNIDQSTREGTVNPLIICVFHTYLLTYQINHLDSLSTTIDDTIEEVAVKVSVNASIIDKNGQIHLTKKRNLIIDSDDEKEMVRELKVAEIKRRKEETNFALDISIEKIKQEYASTQISEGQVDVSSWEGISDNISFIQSKKGIIQASTTTMNKIIPPSSNDGVASTGSNINKDNIDSSAEATVDLSNDLMKYKDAPNQTKNKQAKYRSMHRLLQEFQMIKVRVYYPPNYIAEEAAKTSSLVKHRDIGVYTTWSADIVTNKATNEKLSVCTYDILEYCISFFISQNIPIFPIKLIVNKQEYGLEREDIPLPSSEIIVKVFCAESVEALTTLKYILPRLNYSLFRGSVTSKKKIIHDGILQLVTKYMVYCEESPDKTRNLLDFSYTITTSDKLVCLKVILRAVLNLLELATASSNSYFEIHRLVNTIKINNTVIDGELLCLLTRCASTLDASNCRLNELYLRQFCDYSKIVIKTINNGSDNTLVEAGMKPEKSYIFARLQNLSLCYNYLFGASPTKGSVTTNSYSWIEFVTFLMTNTPLLYQINLSYCVRSKSDISVLSIGIIKGLKARQDAGLATIGLLIIHGLTLTFPDEAKQLQDDIQALDESLIISCDFTGECKGL